MTFSESVKKEFTGDIPRSTCCRRALAYGLLFDANAESGGEIFFDVSGDFLAEYAKSVLEKQFSRGVSCTEITKSGRKYFRIRLSSPSVAERIAVLSSGALKDYIEFKCSECRSSFLRGIFLSRGTVTFAPGNNHLEYRIAHKERAELLRGFLESCGVPPRSIERKGVIGLYFKRGELIEDNMNLMQAKDTFFEIMNGIIERDIRIRENRAVNCESVNIKKAVDTAQKQLKAIAVIEQAGFLEKLDSELYESVRLRLENHDATMSELAEMHDPPITKSRLFNRFEKVFRLAERLNKK